MWKQIILCLALLSILFHSQVNDRPMEARAAAKTHYRPGVVLIQYRPGVTTQGVARLITGRGLQAEKIIPSLQVMALKVPVGQEAAILESLRGLPEIIFAEPDYAAEATETPNDPDWGHQWSLAKIDILPTWNVITGTTTTTIAVLDSGLDLDHPDLVAKLWTNPAEIPDNDLDDDGNGQVNDVFGWHFYHRWADGEFVPAEDGNVQDDYGHGTHVAGIAAAAANNQVGIAGISWGAKIMPVKVLDQYGTGWYSDIAAGIIYAANNGAKIINLSLGGSAGSATLCAAVEYAYNKGVLLTAATGNTGGAVFYPAACPHVLAVAATNQADQRANFSNSGSQIDLAAPGVEIYSTWYRGNYFTKSGTSMATPHVSGLAHLIWSLQPNLTTDEVSRVITVTATDVNAAEWPGWDQYIGWGRINAALATSADLWTRLVGPAEVSTGESITYHLIYGNRGGLPAHEVKLTITTSLNGTSPLYYQVPVLAAAGEPYTYTFSLPLDPETPLGVEVVTTATITSARVELDGVNNIAYKATRVGRLIFLPVLLKQ